ncbi:ABC transporter permease [Granulicella arctica]|uniref:ABC transporter permease n=1 Tax=Granulicella arctica TaxID=940613 RepID=UPI0021E0052B|nr:FtsX-like permease family protein [Granulicella arctica]
MFFRLLLESFLRQRRRKALAGIAILLGTTTVTAMLALATTIGDRISKELAVYGANIVIYPQADQLEVKVGGVSVKPTSGGAYLKESDLPKLKTIFWGNNINGVSPELPFTLPIHDASGTIVEVPAIGLWFHHALTAAPDSIVTGAEKLHPWWKLTGRWPANPTDQSAAEAVIGEALANRLHLKTGDTIDSFFPLTDADVAMRHNPVGFRLTIVGMVSTGDATETKLLLPLAAAQILAGVPGSVRRVEISATTKPEDAFARVDPETLSAKQREIWYCRPYANSIAYQIREVMPGAAAEQVRRVEQSEGTVLSRISGLMWLISAAALLAAGFAVSAAMATAVLERRGEIGLMRSLGASKGAIALLFYAETGLLAIVAGTFGYLIGSGLAAWLGARIFAGSGVAEGHVLNPVLLPVVVAIALVVAIAGSTPSIRTALRMDPSAVLRSDA